MLLNAFYNRNNNRPGRVNGFHMNGAAQVWLVPSSSLISGLPDVKFNKTMTQILALFISVHRTVRAITTSLFGIADIPQQ